MVVLVAFATRHGSTAGIAERIAGTLTREGVPARAMPVAEVRDVRAHEAVVLGSAAYLSHWLRDATTFARHNRVTLRERPVWLFSSGPLGTDPVDAEGRDLIEACRPVEFDQLVPLLRARGERVFFGARDPDARPVTLAEHVAALVPRTRTPLPAGDFRDWEAIEAWAREIAAVLTPDPLRP